MKFLKNITVLTTVLLIVNCGYSQVFQDKHPLDDEYITCCQEKHGDFGARNCAVELHEKWDEEINKYYRLLMNVLDTKEQKKIKRTQSKWLKYKDSEFEFSDKLYDMSGTMYQRLNTQNKMNMVRKRALELKSYYWIRTEEE